MKQRLYLRTSPHPLKKEGRLHYVMLNTGKGKEERWSLLVVEERDAWSGDGRFFYDVAQRRITAKRILSAFSSARALPEELDDLIEDVLSVGADAYTG